jgi:hypothetical protein
MALVLSPPSASALGICVNRAASRRLGVGSRTGAVFRRSGLSVSPRFLWECLSSLGPGGDRGKAERNLS